MSGVHVKLPIDKADPAVPPCRVGTTGGLVCPMSTARACPGDAVLVDGQPGQVRYVGMTKFASGVWCGVELTKPIGKHDGCVQGCRYFSCAKNCGIFVLLDKVTLCKPTEQSSSDSEKKLDLTEVSIDVSDLAGSESAYSSHATLSPRDCLDSSPRSVDSSSQTAPSSAGSGELWWDSDGDALDAVETIGNIDVEEESLGILTPDGMEDQLKLMCSFEHRASLESGEDMERTLVPNQLDFRQCAACDGVLCETDHASVLCVFEGGGEQVFDSAAAADAAIQDSLLDLPLVSSEVANTASVPEAPQSVTTGEADTGSSKSEGTVIDPSSPADAISSDVTMRSTEAPDDGVAVPLECQHPLGTPSVPLDVASHTRDCLSSSSVPLASSVQSSDCFEVVTLPPNTAAGNSSEALPPILSGDSLKPGTLYVDKPGVWASGCHAQVDSDLCSDSALPIESDHEHRLTDVEMESSGVYSDGDSRRSTDPASMIDENGDKLLSPVRETMEEEQCAESTITLCRHSPFSMAVTGSISSVSSDSITLTSQEVCQRGTGHPSENAIDCDSGAPRAGSPETARGVTDPVKTPGTDAVCNGSVRRSCDDDASMTRTSTPERRKSTNTAQTKRAKKQAVSGSTAVKRSRENVPKSQTRADVRAPIKLNHPLPNRNVQSRAFGLLNESAGISKCLQQQRPQSKSRGCQSGSQNSLENSGRQQQNVYDNRSRCKNRSKITNEQSLAHVNTRNRRKLISNMSSCTTDENITFNRGIRPISGSVSPALSDFGRASSASSASSCSSVSVSRSKPSMNPRSSVSLSKPQLTSKLKTNTSSCLVTVRSLIPTALHRAASSNQTAPSHARLKSVPSVTSVPKNHDARRRMVSSRPPDPMRTVSQKQPEPRRKGSVNNNVQENNDKGRSNQAPKSFSTKTSSQKQPMRMVNNERAVADAVDTQSQPKQPAHLLQRKRLEAKITAAREEVRRTAQGFDAAMALLNYICNKMNCFGVFEDLAANKKQISSLRATIEERDSFCARLQHQFSESDLNHQRQTRDLQLRLHQTDERCEQLQKEVQSHELQKEVESQQLQKESQTHQLQKEVETQKLQAEEQNRHPKKEVQNQLLQTEVQIQQLQTDVQTQRLPREVQNQLLQTDDDLVDNEHLGSPPVSDSSDSLRREVESLQHVLQLKCDELCALRRDCAELVELRAAHARLREQSQLQQQKVEELAARLERHMDAERNLTDENKRLRDSQEREFNTNRRLSMQNEQLQYRLRTHQSDSPGSGGSVFRSSSFKFSQSPQGLSRSYSESPRHCSSSESQSLNAVCSVVEKSDSISWTLQLDDSMLTPPPSSRHNKPDSID